MLAKCADGQNPQTALIESSDGSLFGSTPYGGAYGSSSTGGTIFEIPHGGTLITLHSFCSSVNGFGYCTDGNVPKAPLVLGPDGNYYGTTAAGGSENEGLLFSFAPSNTLNATPNQLYNFCSASSCADGAGPEAGLLIFGNAESFTLYGSTAFYGPSGSTYAGTIFTYTNGTPGVFKTGCGFTLPSTSSKPPSCGAGYEPMGALISDSNNNLYGTTYQGGAHEGSGGTGGTVFQIQQADNALGAHWVYSFCSQPDCADGSNPMAGLVQGPEGNFYGTTEGGGTTGSGTIFMITSSGALTTLYSFCQQTGCTDGAEPLDAGPILASDGNLYGTTVDGGAHGGGTVFMISPSGGTPTTLYNFCSVNTPVSCADGESPRGGLIQGSDGSFYGVTNIKGMYGGGTVFKLGLFPFAMVSPTSLTFSNQEFNTSSGPQIVTVTNTGAGSLTISNVSITGANQSDFSQTNNCAPSSPLASGESCQISVTFTPAVAGSFSATLNITDNSSNVAGSTQTVSLSGRGVGPVASLSSNALTYGNQLLGTQSSAQAVLLSNTGFGNLVISSIGLTGAESPDFFKYNNCPLSLAPNAVCEISAIFSPNTTGMLSADVVVIDDSGGMTGAMQTIMLMGTGISVPVTNVSPSTLNFGYHNSGTQSDPQTVTLSNTGNAPLAIGNIATHGDFRQSNACGSSLAVGASCTINVVFAPVVAAGQAPTGLTGVLTITDNNNGVAGSTQAVALSGTGLPPAAMNTLYTFCAQEDCQDGAVPYGGLTVGNSANGVTFYGTTSLGGANYNPALMMTNSGTAFSLSPSMGPMPLYTLLTLYNFCSGPTCPDGFSPTAGLVQDASGNIYGTTLNGGMNGGGTVFLLTDNAFGSPTILSPLYSFCSLGGSACTDGENPQAGLILGNDGSLYGTSLSGGTYGGGTVFKIAPPFNPGSAPTTLYNFCAQSNCADGSAPFGGLMQDVEGNLYGTTQSGGTGGGGTIFKITPAGGFATLYNFCTQANCTDGESPSVSLVQGSDGNLYGTTSFGGANNSGTVFKTSPNGGPPTILHNFCQQAGCADGASPYGALIQANDGNFYGTTAAGGSSPLAAICSGPVAGPYPTAPGCGTVFQITPAGTLSTIYAFCSIQIPQCGDGDAPFAGLVQAADGSFYGTTSSGGNFNEVPDGGGTVFQLAGLPFPMASLSATSLAFQSQNVRVTSTPHSVVLSNLGLGPLNITGITIDGPGAPAGPFAQTNNCGASLAPGTACTIIVTFTPASVGVLLGNLQIADNVAGSPQIVLLSGTGQAPLAGISVNSVTFPAQLLGATSAQTVTVTNQGALPLIITSVVISGADAADFSEVNTCTSPLEEGQSCQISIALIPGATGALSATLTITDNSGGISGATQSVSLNGTGVAPGSGSSPPAVSLSTLYSFCAQALCADGYTPYAALIQGSDGNLYGTTYSSGYGNTGSIFKMTLGGALTTLYTFCSQASCTDGRYPNGPLLEDSGGNFYGATYSGGAHGEGSVYELAPADTVTTVYSFCAQTGCADGAFPQTGLLLASDGNLYGTTAEAGSNVHNGQAGTVFKISPSGTLTTVYSFCAVVSAQGACADGAGPHSGLIQGSDGSLYGTTITGGANGTYPGAGTVFKIPAGHSLTTLYSFCAVNTPVNCADGASPYAQLVQGSDGNLYGTTSGGGANGSGTVFKITTSGTLTTLYNFCAQSNCTDGSEPFSGLVQGSDGNFYGTTYFGGTGAPNNGNGPPGGGTVFRISPGVTLTTLYSFCTQTGCADGNEPYAGLIQASDGSFYGSTTQFGANSAQNAINVGDGGTVFKLNVGLPGATLSTHTLVFGYQTLDQLSPPLTVTLTNPGLGVLNILGISIVPQAGLGSIGEPDLFAEANNCGAALAPGAACTIMVTFTPQSTIGQTATLQITDNGPGSPQIVTVTGNGQTPTLPGVNGPSVSLSPTSLIFPPQPPGPGHNRQTITLTNLGLSPLRISGITINGYFAQTNTCGTIVSAGANCTILVGFNPVGSGTTSGTLSVSDNASGTPQTVTLQGTSILFTGGPAPPTALPSPVAPQPGSSVGASGVKVAPGRQILPARPVSLQPIVTTAAAQSLVRLSSSSLAFAGQLVGTTSGPQTISLTNTTNAPLAITGISVAGDFSQTNDCGATLDAGDHCTVLVTFRPEGPGPGVGTMTISGKLGSRVQTVSLRGQGQPSKSEEHSLPGPNRTPAPPPPI